MKVRFFHDRSSDHQDHEYVAWSVDQDTVPRMGEIVYDPRDALFTEPFYVSSVRWLYHRKPRTGVDELCMVDVYLTPWGLLPVENEV